MIVVSVDYRLGAFGCLRSPGIPEGNLGVSDQLAAQTPHPSPALPRQTTSRTVIALQIHQYRLSQPSTDVPQETAEEIESLLALELPQIYIEVDLSTDVPGLCAAGDTATRGLICGGFTVGGSHDAAWAASSGSWAGRGAAEFATRRVRPGRGLRAAVGTAGLRPTGAVNVGHGEVVAAVQREVLPYDRTSLRHTDRLEPALRSLHGTRSAVREGPGASGEELLRAREAAAMAAHGRWTYHAALQRTESRGMH
ncbi:hypothetical protein [Streptomyces sp. NPDC001135]